MHNFRALLYMIFLLLFTSAVQAQLSETQYAQIDSLFRSWNAPGHPGGSIAVMQGDKTVFSGAYGLASLEYPVPNNPEMRYNIASVSKQFSGLGIVVLHLQHKLSLDAPISRYIDDLPGFGNRITIRQMLHHTSGLRSLHALFALAGWRDDDLRTNADLDRIITAQQDLNFQPGSEYLYCNTGYMFLANIIENVTGQDFTTFMQNEIFEPLGMTATYVEAQYNRVVPDNATSYDATDNGFVRAVEYWGYVGSGNIHTTTADMLKYLKNYYDPRPGWEKAFDMMRTLDPLTDGSFNRYAFGVNIDTLYGQQRISHGGSIGGFRSHAAVFPLKKTSIVVLTNFSSSSPASLSDEIATVIFGKNDQEPPVRTIKLPERYIQNLIGDYWDDKTYEQPRVSARGDTLLLHNGRKISGYLPAAKDSFVPVQPATAEKLSFKGHTLTLYPTAGSPPVQFEKFVKTPPTPALLNSYTGTYYSPELETLYTLHYKDGKLFAYHIRHGKIVLTPVKEDRLQGDYPMRNIKFKRNQNNEITGLYASNGRARNVWFEKTD